MFSFVTGKYAHVITGCLKIVFQGNMVLLLQTVYLRLLLVNTSMLPQTVC